MELTDREYAIVEDVWGSDTPAELEEVDNEIVVAMHSRFSEAIQDAASDRDANALDVLVPLERKVLGEMQARFTEST